MDLFSSPLDEVRFLADQMFDGAIDGPQTARLEALIVNDIACMQAYVERMTFHGELLKDSREMSSAQASSMAIRELAQAVRLRERRRWLVHVGLLSTMALCLIAACGTLFFVINPLRPAPLGAVANLSENFHASTAALDLGQIVRLGEKFIIQEGMISLQLPDVMVDVLGPATVQLNGAGKVFLHRGTLFARILPGGEGFTVTTPDVEVVDLGTEFQVHYSATEGTRVSVRQGRAQASLLDWQRKPIKLLELTDGRSAQFRGATGLAKEVVFQPEIFEPVDQSRGGIRSIDGTIRTTSRVPVALYSGQLQTPNHMLVIPERQNLVLDEDLLVEGISGPVRIAAGSTISSYLVHYDPTALVTTAPRGAVTFFGKVTAVIGRAKGLRETDSFLGLPGVHFEKADYREFELEEDLVRISNDRHTVSFYCGVNPDEFLDEARIIVVMSSPGDALPGPDQHL